MKFSADIPIFAEAKTPKSRSTKPSFCIVSVEFDIPDLDEYDTPLAFLVSHPFEGTPKRQVRAYNDELYCSTKYSLDEFIEEVINSKPLSRSMLSNQSIYKIKQECSQSTYPVVPSGAKKILEDCAEETFFRDHYNSENKFIDDAKSLGNRIERTDEVQSAIEEYKNYVAIKLKDFIVINNVVFQKSGEPFYKTDGEISCIQFTESKTQSNSQHQFTFSASSYDDYVKHINKWVGTKPHSEGSIEIVDSSYLNYDAEEADLDNFCRRLQATLLRTCHRKQEFENHKKSNKPYITFGIHKSNTPYIEAANNFANKHFPSWEKFCQIMRSYSLANGNSLPYELEDAVSNLVLEIKNYNQHPKNNPPSNSELENICEDLNLDLLEEHLSRLEDSAINVIPRDYSSP